MPFCFANTSKSSSCWPFIHLPHCYPSLLLLRCTLPRPWVPLDLLSSPITCTSHVALSVYFFARPAAPLNSDILKLTSRYTGYTQLAWWFGGLGWGGVCVQHSAWAVLGDMQEGGGVFLGKPVFRDMRHGKELKKQYNRKADKIRGGRQDWPTSFLCKLYYLILAYTVLYRLSSTFTCVLSCHEQDITALCFVKDKTVAQRSEMTC